MVWLLAQFPQRLDARLRVDMWRLPRLARFSVICAVLSAAVMMIAGCSVGGGAGAGPLSGLGNFGGPSPQQKAQDTELMLAAAGFRPIAPQTTDTNQLSSLPALKMNYYVNSDGQARYWYADPSYCHCLYLGDNASYQRYENLALQNQMLENQQQTQIQQQQMQQQQMMGPPMMGPPMGFSIGGPGVGIIF
jgi:hypothetical protein